MLLLSLVQLLKTTYFDFVHVLHCPWCVTVIGFVLIVVAPFLMNIVVNLTILPTSQPFIYENFLHECFGVIVTSSFQWEIDNLCKHLHLPPYPLTMVVHT
jgi:hypothetical protein